MPIKKIKDKYNAVVWKTDLKQLSNWQALIIKLMRIYQAALHDLTDGLPSLRAMGLVYTTLLSLVPLLAVSFSVLKGFGVHNQLEPTLLNLLAPLGEKSHQVVEQIIGFVDNMEVGALGTFGLLMLILTVLSLVKKIESAFNFTWKLNTTRGIVQRFSNYLSVIMIGPVLMFTIFGLTATVNHSSAIDSILAIEPFGSLLLMFGKVLPFLLTIVAFTFIYILVPNTKVKFRSALVGAITAGVIWELSSFIFASFIVNSTNYTAIYSSFAILIIFMLWVYASWLIVLTGASIAFYHQHPERTSARQNLLRLSCRLREKLALTIMQMIASHYQKNKHPWSTLQISKTLDIAEEAITLVTQALVKGDLLIAVTNKDATYIPAHPLETITIYTILNAARKGEETASLHPRDVECHDSINRVITKINNSVEDSLDGTYLKDLI